jgi:ribonucleotide reductase beta subunit family protein with ferritin-like domain
MVIDIAQIIAVNMNQLAARDTFKVEMLMAAVVLDILKASARRAVENIFADESLFNQFFELTVDSCRTHWRSLISEENTDFTDVGMSVFIFNQKRKETFLLFCFIAAVIFHNDLQKNENDS